MPFTPFHFGPGLFAKSIVARHFSWLAFIASQIVIDCETLYYLLQRTYPIHRFFHTFFGATLVGGLTGLALFSVKSVASKYVSGSTGLFGRLRPSFRSEFSTSGLFIGALVGGISHPFLDGIMHGDVRSFAPWTNSNPLLGLISWEMLHLSCLIFGMLGLGIMAIRLSREQAG
jgi:membrane-bound metal-dependent hydrolase YbcI (DUF457 family)